MEYNFVLILAVGCLAYGLSSEYVTATTSIDNESIVENEKDEFAKLITLGNMVNLLNNKQENVLKCYELQKKEYEKFVKNFTEETDQAVHRVHLTLGDNPYIATRKSLQQSLQTMVDVMAIHPKKLEKFMSEKPLRKSELMNYIQNTRKIIQDSHRDFMADINRLKEIADEGTAEKNEECFKKIRRDSKKKAREIFSKIRDCVKTKNNKN